MTGKKYKYWQAPSHFTKQLSWTKGYWFPGAYGHVPTSIYLNIFYHRSLFRFLGFFKLLFVIGTGTGWATLSWREEYSGVMFWVNRILYDIHFILFYLLFLGHIQTLWAIKEQGELIWQNSSGSQCKLGSRLLL